MQTRVKKVYLLSFSVLLCLAYQLSGPKRCPNFKEFSFLKVISSGGFSQILC